MLTKAPTIFATTTMQQHIPPLLLRSSIWIFLYLTFPTSTIAFNLGASLGQAPKKLEPPLDLLSGTNLDADRDTVSLIRCYKASEDGFSAVKFHQCADDKGSAIVVCLSRSGAIFGGYNRTSACIEFHICVCRIWLCFCLFSFAFPFLTFQ